MMMGSAEEIPQAPQKGPVFVEDLPEEDQEHAALVWIYSILSLFAENCPHKWNYCINN